MGHYKEMFSLQDRNIIITGGCGLLGRQFCEGVADLGGNVIVADINRAEATLLCNQLTKSYNIKAIPLLLDITSEQSVENMITDIHNNLGSIYGLVNNAYPRNSTYGQKFEDIHYNSWRENIDMHLNGYFNVTQKVAKYMMEQNQGVMINIASIYGVVAPDFSIYEGTNMTMPAEYSAIKGGIITFTKYLATYLSKYNIRVNSISPGGIENGQDEEFISKYCSKTPLSRMGKAEDMVGGLLYLLSDSSKYVTGHNLMIDGGWSTK